MYEYGLISKTLRNIIKCIVFGTMQNNTSSTFLQMCMRMINIRFDIMVTSEEWTEDGITEGCSVGFSCILLV